MSTFFQNPRGQALIEFALILPLLLFVIVGGLGLGLTVIHRMQLQHAAQELSVAAASTDCAAAMTKTRDLLGYTLQTMTCSVAGQEVTVHLAQSWPALVPGLPETISVSAVALLR